MTTMRFRRHTARRFGSIVLCATICLGGLVGGATAEQIVFTIDPTQSSITWSGTSDAIFGGGPIVEQSSGSLTAGLSGHFLVDFDPTTSTPSTISFVGGHGYYQLSSAHTGVLPGSAPANIAGKSGNDSLVFAVRDLVFDVFSPAPVSGTGGVYPANLTHFTILSGGLESNVGDDPYTGATNNIDGGTWTLTESNGEWTLMASTDYFYGYDNTAEFTTNATIRSTAQFSAANVVSSVPTQVGATEPVVVQTLGSETNTPGSVSIALPPVDPGSGETGVTSVVVQEVPSLTSISQEAIAAAESIPIFAAALEDQEIGQPTNLQIWNVHPEGFVNGTSATLVFSYDPSLFAGIDQTKLGIWHYNKVISQWEWGGTVDVGNHTITYTTTSFSEFIAGVPEPSTIVLSAAGLVGLLWFGRKGRAKR